MIHRHQTRGKQGGYALVTSIIFLVILTIVAVAALKSSGLEARMGANTAFHTQALEGSELVRHTVDTLIDANVFNRGWPSSKAGGQVADNQFDCDSLSLIMGPNASPCGSGTTTVGYTIKTDPIRGGLRTWFDNNNGNTGFNPNSLHIDATYTQVIDSKRTINGGLSVYKLYAGLVPGSGSQMDAGYLGLGRSAAAGGGRIFFYVNGDACDYGSSTDCSTSHGAQSSVDTSAVYRELIRN